MATKPQSSPSVTSSVLTGARTPKMRIKFCNVLNAYYYPNSPAIPRYSVTCILEPSNKEHKEFIDNIKKFEKVENVQSTVLKDEIAKGKEANEQIKTGNYLIKFQGKDRIPVYSTQDGKSGKEIKLVDELGTGIDAVIVYDVVRYHKKENGEKGLNFKPKAIYIFEEDASQDDQEGAPF